MMRHAIHLVCFNNLELSKRALASILEQDMPCDVFLTDNGSTDGTKEWMAEQRVTGRCYVDHNISPVKIANGALDDLFHEKGYETVLGVPNDVVLPPNLFRLMDEFPRGVVTASMTSDPNFSHFDKATAVNECTPMCIALVRRWLYDAMVGTYGHFFDEGFFHYASDCDFALRFSALGCRGVQLDVQYFHEVSATIKRSTPEAAAEMHQQADRDREYFVKKWGFPVGDCQYGASAQDINFKGIPRG